MIPYCEMFPEEASQDKTPQDFSSDTSSPSGQSTETDPYQSFAWGPSSATGGDGEDNAEKFRQQVLMRDSTCVLSDTPAQYCDAAHLINKFNPSDVTFLHSAT